MSRRAICTSCWRKRYPHWPELVELGLPPGRCSFCGERRLAVTWLVRRAKQLQETSGERSDETAT